MIEPNRSQTARAPSPTGIRPPFKAGGWWRLVAVVVLLGLGLGACQVKPPSLFGARKGDKPTTQKEEPAKTAAVAEPEATPESPWKPFTDDELHDPDNPGFALLQRPAMSLKDFPRDKSGNFVNWVKALEQGVINPRTNIYPETNVTILDMDVFLNIKGSMPVVRFPHRPHTMWLDCANCHPTIFAPKAGATKMTKLEILDGQFCGRCHGAVAFPLVLCPRCHSLPPGEYFAKYKGQRTEYRDELPPGYSRSEPAQ